MKIKNFHPGWIADNICVICDDATEFDCDNCEVFNLITSDTVKKIYDPEGI